MTTLGNKIKRYILTVWHITSPFIYNYYYYFCIIIGVIRTNECINIKIIKQNYYNENNNDVVFKKQDLLYHGKIDNNI